jgi:hypothetical protein
VCLNRLPMRIFRRLLLLGAAALSSCAPQPTNGALRVLVNLEPDLRSSCAKVVVLGGIESLETLPMSISGRSQLTVGVLQKSLPAEVRVQAVGYQDKDCTVLTVPAEMSEQAPAVFGAGVKLLEITLRKATGDGGTDGGEADGGRDGGEGDGGVDLDGDGYSAPADCDDNNPAVHPNAAEVCTNQLDDDCDQEIDCADSACNGLGCGIGSGAQCVGMSCRELSCGDNLDNDQDGTPDCLDLDCNGLPCGIDGGCQSNICVSSSETGLCADFVDNDKDLKIDCLDSDCSGQQCSDNNPCTVLDVCVGTACSSGTAKACNTPPGQCFTAAGTCLPDAGGACAYPVRVGSCSDGLACTLTDVCQADGGCRGAAKSCPAPPGPCFGAGVCRENLDGGCQYPVLTGACNDLDNCTLADSCAADGGCSGTRVTCTPPGECFTTSTSCLPDAGCIFPFKSSGSPCSVGQCDGMGICTPTPIFPYTPSNFTEAQLPTNAGAMTFNCGVTTLNTDVAGALGWTNNCPGNPTPTFTPVAVGNQTAVLIYVDALTVAATHTLNVVGNRMLIVAVRNLVSISGTLSVRSTRAQAIAGAGANMDCAAPRAGFDGRDGGNPDTAGGGGGAAFGLDGAQGSDGDNGGPGGANGVAFGNTNLIPLHAGCAGGNGGRAFGTFGIGGSGGGAIQVSSAAAMSITDTGIVTASGAAGSGGEANLRMAGGGAGSGGGILLQAVTISVANAAAITANGGAGGEGSGTGMINGTNGADGTINTTARAAGGLNNASCGGAGGNGGARAGAPSAGGNPVSCGGGFQNPPGGGGGGAVGRIRLHASTSCSIKAGAIISPAATSNGTTGCP